MAKYGEVFEVSWVARAADDDSFANLVMQLLHKSLYGSSLVPVSFSQYPVRAPNIKLRGTRSSMGLSGLAQTGFPTHFGLFRFMIKINEAAMFA